MIWEYSDHPDRDSVTESCRKIQNDLIANEGMRCCALTDTRPFHLEMFSRVVPLGFEGFAGSYRGSTYSYLRSSPVEIGGYDGAGKYHVLHRGTPPECVAAEMEEFHNQLKEDLDKLTKREANTEEKIILLAHILSKYVVVFLSIHPYANGNGHVSRLIAWGVFLIRGFSIHGWDLDKRPEQPFDRFIKLYQDGERKAMISYFYYVLKKEVLPSLQENS